MKFTKHIVADMDASMVQRCLICGTVINDYRNLVQASGSPVPKEYAAGEVFISDTNNPRISTIQEPTDYFIEDCTP